MKRQPLRCIAMLLSLLLLLTGCRIEGFLPDIARWKPVPYKEMEYTRPDMDQLQAVLEESCDVLSVTTSVSEASDAIIHYYDVYDGFYTNYYLAQIRYHCNLTDSYWEEETRFCSENSPAAEDGLDALYSTLATAPIRSRLEDEGYFSEGFLDGYLDYESDEALLALQEQEANLINRYYELYQAAYEVTEEETYDAAVYQPMAELFAQLVALRQQIATASGYGSYPEFAYDCYYYRPYTPQQAEAYLQSMCQALYTPYVQANQSQVWEDAYAPCGEDNTFQYVKTAAQAMGEPISDAFSHLEQYGLYDISYQENKYESSYEVFLTSYYQPFIFLCPTLDQTDKLTFAHEFGHFAADYVCDGTYASTDVAEVHSQAFEYLSLIYGENTQQLTRYKIADSLCTYMECGAYTLFEQQVYGLTGDALTPENITAIFQSVMAKFGFDSAQWDSRDWVFVTHFFTEPMYMISYVLSNDLALQLYQLEQAQTGEGLCVYTDCLSSEDTDIFVFAESYGLEDPLSTQRIDKAADLFNATFPQ